LREALEAQLIEANAEIVASWDRRKEMARVIAEQQTQLGQASAELAGLKQGREKADKLISKLEQVIAHRDQMISKLEQVIAHRDQMISNREQAIAKRDEALSKRELVIVNREKKIRQLKADLRARYEELAALQRHMVESSLSGKAKRLARRARGFARKSFPA
jgi:chromosome segregation ATPase